MLAGGCAHDMTRQGVVELVEPANVIDVGRDGRDELAAGALAVKAGLFGQHRHRLAPYSLGDRARPAGPGSA